MYNFLSLLIGAFIAIMVAFNGRLSESLGNYLSLVIIHIVGFIVLLIIIKYKKLKISFKNHLPFYFYIAGSISIFTVMFNNLSFPVLGVSIPVALGLLGQSIASLAFDQYGFLGMQKVKFDKRKFIGLGIILLGISIMTFF